MTVRVGFLGAGLIATYHSKMLARSGEDVAWAGVHDPDPARAAAFAAATGATACPTEDDVLDGCDAAYVCTWTAEHPRLVAAAAARGLAVFCEKPLAVDLAGAVAVHRAVAAAGVVNQVGLVLRHSPAFVLLRSLVADPASGRVMAVVFRDDQYLPTQGFYGSTWRGDVAKAGAGTLLEHSIHDLDVLEWLCGPVVRVAAETAGFHAIPGIEDVAVATMRFAGGATASLTSVWHDVLDRPSLRRVEVLCERAWYALEGDWWGPVRWTRQGGGDRAVEGEALVTALAERGEAPANPDGRFVRAVAAGEPAWPDVATALRAHVVADAAYGSAAAGGGAVTVPPGLPG